MIKNVANQTVGAELIDATTGSAFAGVVTVHVTGDAGTQATGSVGSGICTAEGNGYYSYVPSAAETNYNLVAFTFTGTNAIPKTVQYEPLTAAQAAALSAATAVNAVTARTLITKSLRRIGVVGAGQTLSPEDADDALFLLNSLLDMFATERLMVPVITRSTWTIVAGTGTYTVGDGGDVDIARPVFVEDVRFIDTSADPETEHPLGMLTDRAYAKAQKSLTSLYPSQRYWNPTFTGTGLGSVTLWPIPTSTTLLGAFYAATALTQVASLDTTLILPPGYRYFLQEQLAVICAPEWGIPLPAELRENARESKANIKRANTRLVELATWEGAIFGGHGMYDIYSDS